MRIHPAAPLSGARTHDVRTCACGCRRPSCVMCAETYAWGESGNTTCPENATQIGSAEACQRAAAAMGKDWRGPQNETETPSGCYGINGVNVYFNKHPVGAGYPYARPLCAVGTCPPRTRRAVPPLRNAHAGCAGAAEHRRPRPCGVHPEPLHHCRADPVRSHARRARPCRMQFMRRGAPRLSCAGGGGGTAATTRAPLPAASGASGAPLPDSGSR